MQWFEFLNHSNLPYCPDINSVVESEKTSSVIVATAVMSTAAVIIVTSLTVFVLLFLVYRKRTIS